MKVENTVLDLRLEKFRVAFHVLFWLGVVAYEGLVWGLVDGQYGQRLLSSLVDLPVKIGAAYFTLYILVDRFLIKKKYTTFLVLLFTSMLVFGILSRILAYYIIYPLYYPDATTVPMLYLPKILIMIFSIYSLVGIITSFHLIRHWYRHQQAAQELERSRQVLENEMLEAKLKFLKSQINPHFLFNTLNNLYVLALDQSARTPEVIHRLSELTSYMLHEGNHKLVDLDHELHYIQNYMELERMRYDSTVDISLNVHNSVSGVQIAPLLLLPFVENAFKHGLSSGLSGGWLRIDIYYARGLLTVKVENSKAASVKSALPKSGIGLQNVRSRLDLIYTDCYTLDINSEPEVHSVMLRINLGETQAVVIAQQQTQTTA
ncbi:MAG: histidine kinase [Cyclobacteriaceae bacterium]|nr:histidine kinase [Cyclobacteriaceae bacterium]